MNGWTKFQLTFDEIEAIYREGWDDGPSFDGDFSDELGALEAANEAWDESRSKALLFRLESES